MSIRIGGKVVSGDLVGGSVVINGVKITSGGRGITIIDSGEDAPEVHESYDGIRAVSIDADGGSVSLKNGEKFSADGHGVCRKSGNTAHVTSFEGELTVPVLDRFDVTINSGSVHGEVGATSVDAKINSGSLTLAIHHKDHAPSINAKVNSGNVSITVL